MNRVWVYHDSQDIIYRDPPGAVPVGTRVKLALRVSLDGTGEAFPGASPLPVQGGDREGGGGGGSPFPGSAAAFLHYFTLQGETRELGMEVAREAGRERLYQVEVGAPSTPGLLWYCFRVHWEGVSYYYGNNREYLGGVGQVYRQEPVYYQVTVHREGLQTPPWFKETVLYQVFVERFFNGNPGGEISAPKENSLLHSHWENTPVYIREVETGRVVRWDFFGGNLEGVRKKLPYLKGLGVGALYLNPVFQAPSNHKYDTADYHEIDPMYGNKELFRELCREAEGMGIKIILDGVFSHTGSDSLYFNKEGNYDSLGAFQSPGSPYYSWYRFNSYPHHYDSWWGIETMPNVNELEPSYQDFIIFGENSVLRHWQGLGARGWRLDVVDELPGEFVKNLRKVMKELDSQAVLIGEVWEDASHKISYGERREYLLGEELDSVTNYPLRQAILDYLAYGKQVPEVVRALMSLWENYPREHFYSTVNLLGSHDVPRALTALGEGLPPGYSPEEREGAARSRLKMASLWQFTFPGVPCIYYGDEAGMEGGDDPLNRKAFPWGKEDQEIQGWYREMAALRNHYDVLRTGQWAPLETPGDLFGFLRVIQGGLDVFSQEKKDNLALVLFNRHLTEGREVTLDLSPWCREGGTLVDVLEGCREVGLEGGQLRLDLAPLQGKLLLRDRWGSSGGEEERQGGVLLHPTSLPSPYGIGDLGPGAYRFVDFLAASGQKLWQVLPLNPPGLGDSPYQCYSAFAGNPLLIDPEGLVEEGWLDREDLGEHRRPGFPQDRVDYARAREYKEQLFRKAFYKFETREEPEAYRDFCRENQGWLGDYALFMALKKHFGDQGWDQWEEPVARREAGTLATLARVFALEIHYQQFLQYLFFKQWQGLRGYARGKGLRIIGDLPIFVAQDSSDVWGNPGLFQLDPAGRPTKVAGVPPDYFSETGQRWGNPLYRWEVMEKDGYSWWKKRFRSLYSLVDIIRLDHFRGFEAFWEIPAEQQDAIQGRWVQGPGEKFFACLREELGEMPVIAENLGYITPPVEELRVRFDFPGMKVMQFMLEEEPGEPFRFPLYEKDCALYTGTHDNDTILGWHKEKVLGDPGAPLGPKEAGETCWGYIEKALASPARMVIIPLQDILCLGSQARMNTPSTLGGNWSWRFREGQLTGETQEKLASLAQRYRR